MGVLLRVSSPYPRKVKVLESTSPANWMKTQGKSIIFSTRLSPLFPPSDGFAATVLNFRVSSHENHNLCGGQNPRIFRARLCLDVIRETHESAWENLPSRFSGPFSGGGDRQAYPRHTSREAKRTHQWSICSGFPARHLPKLGIEPMSPALADGFFDNG